LSLGFKGVDIGIILKHMLEKVKENPTINTKAHLISLI
jgi:hypothetical protein